MVIENNMWTPRQQQQIANGDFSPFLDITTTIDADDTGRLFHVAAEFTRLVAISSDEKTAKQQILKLLKKKARRLMKDISAFERSIDKPL